MARMGAASTTKQNSIHTSTTSSGRDITMRRSSGRSRREDADSDEQRRESSSNLQPRTRTQTPSEQVGSSSRSTTATADANGAEHGMRRSRSGRRIMPVTRKDAIEESDAEKGGSNARRSAHTSTPISTAATKRGRQSTTAIKRGRKSKTGPIAEEEDEDDGESTAIQSLAPREESEEERAKREREEVELMERWHEEYFEIVEQLPLELQRSYALMREMETKFQDRVQLVASRTRAYRDARIIYANLTPEQKAAEIAREKQSIQDALDKSTLPHEEGISLSEADAEGEDDAEVFHELAGDLLPKPDLENTAASEESQPEQRQNFNDQEEEVTINQISDTKERPSDDTPLPTNPSAHLAPTRTERLSLLASIAQASSESIKIAEEKVGLAVTAYNWIDRQIRRLDADLQKSENTLLLGLRAGTEASRGLQDALGIDYTKGQGAHRWDDVENLLMGRPSGNRSQTNEMAGVIGERESSSEGVGKKGTKEQVESHTNGGDMAVDPNEPTYCYCDEVSSGEMVACDNEDCPREWFHLPCVGFTQPPKGRWFCLFCAPAGYKGSGTYPPDAPCLPLHLLAFNPNVNGKRSSKSTSGNGRNKRKR